MGRCAKQARLFLMAEGKKTNPQITYSNRGLYVAWFRRLLGEENEYVVIQRQIIGF